MERFLWVCLGSAIGGGARYLASVAALRLLGPAFPFGTLAVNVAGSFLIGFIMQAGVGASPESATLRIFLTVGVLGGFTTFSTFSYETLNLLRTGALGTAFLYLALSIVASLAACLLGVYLLRSIQA